MRLFAFTACILFVACDGSEPAAPSGVAPNASPSSSTDTRPAVELSAPLEATPQPTIETTPAVVAPAPKITFEIEPLGRFEVITWDEAARRAEQNITPETAQATLRTLRQDLLGRRR